MRGALIALVVVLAVVASSFLVVAQRPVLLPGTAPSTAPGSHLSPAGIVTHGDLVVLPGTVYTIHPTPGSSNFYMGGNITVEAGGTLIVRNVTVSFVEFVGVSGTPISRLSHIYHFNDFGTVDLYNSTVTTEVLALPDAYAKLALTVTGSMSLWNSSLAFPGWVTVNGTGATLYLNNSAIRSNPEVASLVEPSVILGDTEWAPTVKVEGGGTLDLFGSLVNNTYADDSQVNGLPAPVPLNVTNVDLTGGLNFTSLFTPSDTVNLSRDWLYPYGVAGGEVGVYYNDTNALVTTVGITVWYAGVGYPLGTLTLLNDTINGFTAVPFTAALTQAVNKAGMLNYLNYTGDFGVGPSRIAVETTSSSGPTVPVSQLFFALTPPLSYDITVTGAGSQLNSVDTPFDLTFADVPASPVSQVSPYPWFSNKLLLTDGATAYLGNMTILNPIPGVFTTSAILPDATSNAYLYRWTGFNMTGLGGVLPVQGGTVHAYSSLNESETNNATANHLNNLSSANPAIWSYLQYWDAKHGLPAYGTSGFNGTAYLLLASSQVNGTTLPDGNFIGGYHLFIKVPASTNSTRSFNWSGVSPYPFGVAFGTPRYGMPDFGPGINFPSYFVGLSATAIVTANATVAPNATVRIGQVFGAEMVLNDTGTGKVFYVQASLYWNATRELTLDRAAFPVDLVAPGQKFIFNLTWIINDTITGLQGKPFAHQFEVNVTVNEDLAKYGGRNFSLGVPSVIKQSEVGLFNLSLPPSPLSLGGTYFTDGVVRYNGSQPATLYVIATPVNGGGQITIGIGAAFAGPFTVHWLPLSNYLSAGTTYYISVEAIYNNVTNLTRLSGEYSVPPSSPSVSNFLFEKFLGLPLWAWLAIAAAVAVGIVAVLLVARRQAAGKLVECGECGNLIPEDATTCPKCGAEFESDLIRCSRCASTIPADSKFCPECAAQLLGKPGEGEADPERQGYDDYTQKYRAEAKKELGENYNEGSFWDWWKRQPTYTSFSQWKLQQGQGIPRAGMTAPPPGEVSAPTGGPPKQGGGAAPAPGDTGAPLRAAAPTPPVTPPPAAAGAMKPCPSCGKEIPTEYLICPFCSAVTQ